MSRSAALVTPSRIAASLRGPDAGRFEVTAEEFAGLVERLDRERAEWCAAHGLDPRTGDARLRFLAARVKARREGVSLAA